MGQAGPIEHGAAREAHRPSQDTSPKVTKIRPALNANAIRAPVHFDNETYRPASRKKA